MLTSSLSSGALRTTLCAQLLPRLRLPNQRRASLGWEGGENPRAMSSGNVGQTELLEQLGRIIPPLSGSNYKGQHGKIGVVGGCREYTGAPFFAAISSLKVGADLCWIICTESAATAIKSYSPEIIVLPYLPEEDQAHGDVRPEVSDEHVLGLITPWLKKLTCLIIGPGLGSDPWTVSASRQVMKAARGMGLPMVVDGSALNFVAKEPDLVKGFPSCILTPNIAELGRLAEGVGVKLEGSIGHRWQSQAQQVGAAFGGPVLVSKGPHDVICGGGLDGVMVCGEKSSLKRAGGQGDVLTGAMATMLSWALLHDKGQSAEASLSGISPFVLAAYGGSLLTRKASALAFQQHKRSMMAGDIIHYLMPALEEVERGSVEKNGTAKI